MYQNQPKVHPVVLIGTLLLLASMGVIYVITQGDFRNLDFRSQAARPCPERCAFTCRNKPEPIRNQCITNCVTRCENASSNSTLGTCTKKGNLDSCKNVTCGNFDNKGPTCREYTNCCNWNPQAVPTNAPGKCGKKSPYPNGCTDGCTYANRISCLDSSTCCIWKTTSNSGSGSNPPGTCQKKDHPATTCGTHDCSKDNYPTCKENGGCCEWK